MGWKAVGARMVRRWRARSMEAMIGDGDVRERCVAPAVCFQRGFMIA